MIEYRALLKNKLFLGLIAEMLSAYASTSPLATNGEVKVVDMRELPAPADQAAIDPGNVGHQIGTYDRIVVEVLGFPEVNAHSIQAESVLTLMDLSLEGVGP